MQALSKSDPGYSEKNGLGVMAVEHNHPKLWRNKAVCTIDDEGRCYGCEMNNKFPKTGWKQKSKLYINVLADHGDGDPKVEVLSSGWGKGQVAPVLVDFLKGEPDDDEPQSLIKTKFRITREGGGLQDTSYIVTPRGTSKVDIEDYDLFDIRNNVLRTIPYGEQEAFYNRGATPDENEDGELVAAGSASPEQEW